MMLDGKAFARGHGLWLGASALTLGMGWAGPAQAQDVPPPNPPAISAAQDGEASPAQEAAIIVTATRTRSEFEAPTATQIIGADQLEARGAANVFDIVEEMPAFNTRLSPAANGVRTQSVGQTYADLRGLGSSRTLVLVNGRRFVPVVPTVSVGNPYQVDLNLIPSLMVDRIDVVTGGASAQWGSDAVAGVVNMVLRRSFDGIKIEAQGGISDEGDGESYRIGGVAGFDFADGRGNVVVSGDYVVNEGIDNFLQREWAKDEFQFFTDPAATFENGLPSMVLRPNTQAGDMAPGGLIVGSTGLTPAQADALRALQFDSATTVSPFQFGEFNQGRFTANQAGGASRESPFRSLVPSIERKVFYGLATFDINDSLEVFLEGSWGRSEGENINMPIRDRAGVYNPATGAGSQVRIYSDNPFIPDAIRPFIPAPEGPSTATPPDQSFTLARNSYDFDQPRTQLRHTAYTVSTGLIGELSATWGWDASFTYGRDTYFRQTFNMRDRLLYGLAADAVVDPVSGDIVCRSTLTDPGNGCVPVNLFGSGTPSAEAQAYFLGTPFAQMVYQQRALQANLRGEPFDTWAGPVSVAIGGEYRSEEGTATVDAISPLNRWDLNLGEAFSGEFDVKEGYVEATVPLARDMAFARTLTLNGAVRYADYSRSGPVTTWKVGGTWEPIDDVLVRTSHSLDIRAPSIFELDSPQNTFINTVVFNGQTYGGVLVATGGNPDLQPEHSKTTTVGVALTPSFLPRLRMSVDYFNINVRDVISTIGQTEIFRFCELGDQSFCDLITFNNAGAPTNVLNSFLNLSSLKTSGLDILASYTAPLFSGAIDFRLNATYVDEYTITAPSGPSEPPAVNEQAGQLDNTEGAVPHWRGVFSANYEQDPFSVRAQVRWVGPGVMDNSLTEVPTDGQPRDIDPDVNNIGHYFVFGVGGTVDLGSPDREFFWNIENIFDRDPPIIPSTSLRVQTNAQFYDVLGRYFRAGVRLQF